MGTERSRKVRSTRGTKRKARATAVAAVQTSAVALRKGKVAGGRLALQLPANDALQRIGTRLHHLRQMRELRMKDVAAAAGCSESMISKIENNKAMPSLGVLHRICEVLNVALGELLTAPDENGGVVTRAGERRIVDIDPLRKGTGIRLERLVPYAKGHLLQGNIHIVAPGGSTDGTISHSGEEVGYVLAGEIELTVGDETYSLKAGDSFCYNSDLRHGYRNPGNVEARVLFVNTPPSF
jgi:transcriptional regulator with XRE-family HTH domain